MKIRAFVAAATCVALAGCGTGRLLSYGGQLADGKTRLGQAEFQIYVHPSDQTILIQRSFGQIAGGIDHPHEFTAAAQQFVAPVGCTVQPSQQISAGSFEAAYRCPDDIDLPSLVAQQRSALRAGQPLRSPQ